MYMFISWINSRLLLLYVYTVACYVYVSVLIPGSYGNVSLLLVEHHIHVL